MWDFMTSIYFFVFAVVGLLGAGLVIVLAIMTAAKDVRKHFND